MPPSTFGLPSLTLPTFQGFFSTPSPPPKRIAGKRKPKKRKTTKQRDFDFGLAPSFTAIIADLKGRFPKEIKLGKVKLGISPRRIRVLPGRRKKRKWLIH